MTHLIEQVISEYQRKKTAALNEAGKEALSAHGFTFDSDEELLNFVSRNVIVSTHPFDPTSKSYFLNRDGKQKIMLCTWDGIEGNVMQFNYKIYYP